MWFIDTRVTDVILTDTSTYPFFMELQIEKGLRLYFEPLFVQMSLSVYLRKAHVIMVNVYCFFFMRMQKASRQSFFRSELQ